MSPSSSAPGTPCLRADSVCVPVDVPGADLAFRVTWPGEPPADYSALRHIVVRHLLRDLKLTKFDLALTPQLDGTILAIVTNTQPRKATHGGTRKYERYLQFGRGQAPIPVPA